MTSWKSTKKSWKKTVFWRRNEKGIEPDVEVEFDADAYYNEGVDNQLQEAVKYLSEKVGK